MAARQTRQLARQGRAFSDHVVPAIIKPVRTLWNQFIAFLFCCFAILFGFRAVRLAMELHNSPAAEGMGPLLRFAVSAFCTILMLWFGIGSFLRARKISRS